MMIVLEVKAHRQSEQGWNLEESTDTFHLKSSNTGRHDT